MILIFIFGYVLADIDICSDAYAYASEALNKSMQGIALCEGINQRARGRPVRPPRGRGQGKALGPGEKRIYRCYSVKEAFTANNIHDRYIEVVHILAFHSRHTRPLLLSLTSTMPSLDVASGTSNELRR